MNNPWLEISHSDYENHMTEIGQAQVLSNLVKYGLEKYRPQRFALLGCSTGNGLEHVNPKITSKIYAIDINPKYLEILKKNFEERINDLELIRADIQNDELIFRNVDLFFIGLVLEYAEPEKSLQNIIRTLGEKGVLIIVIQKNNQSSFVTKTKYRSLETLTAISKEVNETAMDRFIRSEKLSAMKRSVIELANNKSFIMLEYSWLISESPKGKKMEKS
jgi:SAM-dependent methyltransferase